MYFFLLVTGNHDRKFPILFQNLRSELAYTVLYDQHPLLNLDRNQNYVISMQNWSFATVNVMWNGGLDKHRRGINFFFINFKGQQRCVLKILNFQSFIDFNVRVPFCWSGNRVFAICSYCLIWCPNFGIFPPTYHRTIGEVEGRVRETNIF
jgi:hypothetical protein